jgi:hypothetical protein
MTMKNQVKAKYGESKSGGVGLRKRKNTTP